MSLQGWSVEGKVVYCRNWLAVAMYESSRNNDNVHKLLVVGQWEISTSAL